MAKKRRHKRRKTRKPNPYGIAGRPIGPGSAPSGVPGTNQQGPTGGGGGGGSQYSTPSAIGGGAAVAASQAAAEDKPGGRSPAQAAEAASQAYGPSGASGTTSTGREPRDRKPLDYSTETERHKNLLDLPDPIPGIKEIVNKPIKIGDMQKRVAEALRTTADRLDRDTPDYEITPAPDVLGDQERRRASESTQQQYGIPGVDFDEAKRDLGRLMRGEPIKPPQSASQESADRKAERKANRDYIRPVGVGETVADGAEDLAAGGVVGLVDEDVAAAGRKVVYGTENPGALDLAIAGAPLPVGRLARVGKTVLGAFRGAKGVDEAVQVAKATDEVADFAGISGKRLRKAEQRLTPKGPGRIRSTVRAAGQPRQAGKRLLKARKPRPRSPEARRLFAYRHATRAQQLGALAGGAAALPTGVVAATGEAAVEDPLGTAGTTARMLPAVVTGPVKIAGDVVEAVKEGDLDPLEAEAQSQMKYWEDLGQIAAGEDITVQRPKRDEDGNLVSDKEGTPVFEDVQLSPSEAIAQEYGFTPIITGALVGGGIAKALEKTTGRRATTRREARHAEPSKLEERLQSPDRNKRIKASRKSQKMQDKEARPMREHRGRKDVARRKGIKEASQTAKVAAEFKTAGRGRNTMLRRGERLKRKPIGDGSVSLGDTVRILGSRGIDLNDSRSAVRRLKKYRSELAEPSRPVRPDSVITRPVLDNLISELERNPNILKDKDLRAEVEAHKKVTAEQAQERGRTGDDEARRLAPVTAELGILKRNERIPDEVRNYTDLTAKSGVDATKALREEARSDRAKAKTEKSKARELETKAREIEQSQKTALRPAGNRKAEVKAASRRVKKLEARLERLRKPGKKRNTAAEEKVRKEIASLHAVVRMGAGAKRIEATKRLIQTREAATQARERAAFLNHRAMVKDAHTGRFRRANRKQHEADDLEAEGKFDEAAKLREESKREIDKALKSSEKLRDETIRETLDAIENTPGVVQPGYFKERPAETQLATAGQGAAASVPSRDKRRQGTLAAEGRLDESLESVLAGIAEGRADIESRTMMRDYLDSSFWEAPSGRTVFTRDEAITAKDSGQIPRGYEEVPVSTFERVFAPQKWEEAAGRYEDVHLRELRDARRRADGERYVFLPKHEMDEWRALSDPPSKMVKALRAGNLVQSGLLLGTSPSWAIMQIPATLISAVIHNSNPVAWIRGAQFRATKWREIDPKKRAAFQSTFGSTRNDPLMRDAITKDLTPDTLQTFKDGFDVAQRTVAGRLLKRTAKILKEGGPLIIANRKFENSIRTQLGIMEAQKIVNSPRAEKFIGSMSHLNAAIAKDMRDHRVNSTKDKIEYLADNPEQARTVIGERILDAQGDFFSMTAREKRLAPVAAFYGFLRFSMKWTFVSMPKHHPVKYAMLLNLAQQNSQELEALIGEPGFFTGWATAVTHTGPDGEATVGIDTARFNPGSNALIEALGAVGADTKPSTALARVLQPAFGIALSTLDKTDPFTGEESQEPREVILGRQLLNLTPFTRPIARELAGGPSPVSQLFDKITERDRGLQGYLVPNVTKNLADEKRAQGLSRLLDDAGNKPDIAAILSRVTASPDPVKAAKAEGHQAAEQIQRAQAASDALDRLLNAYGLGDSPEVEKAVKEFFSIYTPASFGNEPGGSKPELDLGTSESGKLDLGGSSSSGKLDLGSAGDAELDLSAAGKPGRQIAKSVSKGGKVKQRTRNELIAAVRKSIPQAAANLSPEQAEMAKAAIPAAKKTGIPASVLVALSGQESGFGTNQGPSSAGARGVTQFIPSTRQSFIDKYDVDPWKDEESGMLAAGLYLRDLGFKEDPQGALSAYSGGYAAEDYNNPILESAKSFEALDHAKPKDVPKRLKSRAEKVLGKKQTQQIIKNAGEPAEPKQIRGQWAGSQRAVLSLVPKGYRAEGRGDKRTPEENAAVGGSDTSDHLTTNEKSYAADLPADDELAQKIAERIGMPSHTGTNEVVKDGYRYQLIWQDEGHYDHIHFGAEWVGEGVPEGTTLGGPAPSSSSGSSGSYGVASTAPTGAGAAPSGQQDAVGFFQQAAAMTPRQLQRAMRPSNFYGMSLKSPNRYELPEVRKGRTVLSDGIQMPDPITYDIPVEAEVDELIARLRTLRSTS